MREYLSHKLTLILDILVPLKMHPLKRRKLELNRANTNVAKPFRSPVRADTSRGPTNSSAYDESSHTHAAWNDSQETKPVPRDDYSPNRVSSSQVTLYPIMNTLDTASASDPAALQREYAALGRQLTSVRQSLDTAQQALQIRTADQDVQTQTLIAKWRGVVRDAAEDLFEAAKESFKSQSIDDRQQQDPGPTAWEEEQRKELTEDQREMLDIHEAEAKAQAEKYGLLERLESPDEGSSVSTPSRCVS